MTRSLNRISLVMLLGFFVVAISLTYWSAIDADSMLARDDNPRRVEAERALLRGAIYDRYMQVLARTVNTGVSPSGKPVVRREYPFAEASSAVGYYSLVHGVGGAEAAFDNQLRGDDLRDPGSRLLDDLLHRQQVGSELRLTLDVRLQTAIAAALKNRRGAVIAIEVPSGAVLALVSTPTFDPNTLDQAYDALQKDPSAPLLNRVTQGLYQPGGSLQTVILAAMLTEKTTLTMPVSAALVPVQIDGLSLGCAIQGNAVTLEDAYGMACPAAFADAVANKPGPASLQSMMDAFGLLQAPTLVNFQTVSGKAITPWTQIDDAAKLRAESAGQGQLTVTPLQMALVAATIANHGNAVTPYLADAIRPPGSVDWRSVAATQTPHAVITQSVADSIGQAMENAVKVGAAQAADRQGLTVRGHASIAYTGPNQQQAAWFVGYTTLPNGSAVAVAVVVEGADAPVASDVGGTTLVQAVQLAKP